MFIAGNEIYHWLLFNKNAVGIKISKINIINDELTPMVNYISVPNTSMLVLQSLCSWTCTPFFPMIE